MAAPHSNGAARNVSTYLKYFRNVKGQRGFKSTLAFFSEPEGLSPDGGLSYPISAKPYQTGEPRGLSPSGGKTPAKPHVSLRPCAHSAQSERGSAPERRPWGRKRRKREAFRRAFLERLAYLYIPRALWAQCGVKGHCPLCEP